MNKKTIKHAIIDAGVTVGYIVLLVTLIFNGGKIFGGAEPENNLLFPIVFLLLFVISAAITSFMVFGRPVMWYIDGHKKEALQLLGLTLGFLVFIAMFFLSVIFASF